MGDALKITLDLFMNKYENMTGPNGKNVMAWKSSVNCT